MTIDNIALTQAEWHRLNRERLKQRQLDHPDVTYEQIRGVAVPVTPGMSKLAKDLARKAAVKRLRDDDRKAKTLVQAIARAKAQELKELP